MVVVVVVVGGNVVVVGGIMVGHSVPQYSQCPPPITCTPFSSTRVEHQGVGSPSIVVQPVCSTFMNVNGKTQLPQEELPEPVVVVVVGPDVVVVVFQ